MSRRWWLLLALGVLLMGAFFFVVLMAGGRKYEARDGRAAMKGKQDEAQAHLDGLSDRFVEVAPGSPAPPAAVDAPPPPPSEPEPEKPSDLRDPFQAAVPWHGRYDGPATGEGRAEKSNLKQEVGRLSARESKEMADFETRRGRLADRELAIGAKGHLGADETIALEDGAHRIDLAKSQDDAKNKRGTRAGDFAQADRDEPDDATRGEGEGQGRQKPESFLPRTCYFENTYLGGNAAYAERLRRLDDAIGWLRPHHEARLPPQPFDAPTDDGLSLTATLDRSWLDKPGKVILQVGLQGSHRFGWRRPPLDVVLVVDQGVVARPRDIPEAIEALRKRLGPRDRMGIVLVAPTPLVITALSPVREVREKVAAVLPKLRKPRDGGPPALAAALAGAGDMLRRAAGDAARVPGSQTVLVLARGGDASRVQAATRQVHELTLQGAVTSVIDLAPSGGSWWSVAGAGHGNFHRATEGVDKAVEAELDSLSRVIARLLRINVRLAKDVEAIRVIGSRVLGQDEVTRVKAREVATDQNLSKTLGVTADRGEDDDGVQTVIPYFYGGDAHVVLIELWVDKPGPVADVTLRYKDMVALDNATARASVQLSSLPRPPTLPPSWVVDRHGPTLARAHAALRPRPPQHAHEQIECPALASDRRPGVAG